MVMRDPFGEDLSEVRSLSGISQSRHSRRMVPIIRSQNAFACGVRTGVFSTRRPIDATASVHGRGEDPIAVMHQIPVRTLAGDRHAELLDRPLRRGCSVTFQWTIRRVPTSRTTKT